jgi:hypothetical protein
MVADKVLVSGIKKATSGWAPRVWKNSKSKLSVPVGLNSRLRGLSSKRWVRVPIIPSLMPKTVNMGTIKAIIEKIEHKEKSQS